MKKNVKKSVKINVASISKKQLLFIIGYLSFMLALVQ